MREIAGQLHDGATARSRDACLRVYPDGTARLAIGGVEHSLTIHDLGVPARLGNTARRIRLPDGGAFETLDNDGVDAVLVMHTQQRINWVHRLENRLGLVLVSTVVVMLAAGAFIVWGVPAVAHRAAFAVSPELAGKIGSGTLTILDQTLDVSELPDERQAALRAGFADVLEAAPSGYEFELLFRAGGPLGANAFALPSGTVLVTDELIGLAEEDAEIVAVLAHEVGHVVHRHGLRHAIQSSLLAVGILIVTGDVSSTSGFVAALPTALAEANFSREFEREADDYSVAYLRDAGIPTSHFAALLERLEQDHGGGDGFGTFLASHPSTDERIERLREGSAAEPR